MNRTIHYQITEQEQQLTIRQFLISCGYSRHILTHLKNTEMGICVNQNPVYLNHVLQKGEQLTVSLKEEISSLNIQPIALPLSVVYEDADILVVNKPANMPIHPSMNHHDNTLANAASYYYQSQGLPFVFRCPNRLDRDTSGLTVLAKNMLSASILSDMVKARTLKRTYLAIVEGIPEPAGTIDAPIARKEGSTIERTVDFAHGEAAVTHFVRLKTVSIQNKSYSLLELSLDTGRTHQIRVHMHYIGHPLPGDFLYHPDTALISRQALHSYSLRFLHPITGSPLYFEAALPADMQRIISFP